jgi:hypothetical protein
VAHDARQPSGVRAGRDDDVDAAVGAPLKAVTDGGRHPRERRRTGLSEHGDPLALALGQRTVVQDDDGAVTTLPTTRVDLTPHAVRTDAYRCELGPAHDVVLRQTKVVEVARKQQAAGHPTQRPDLGVAGKRPSTAVGLLTPRRRL